MLLTVCVRVFTRTRGHSDTVTNVRRMFFYNVLKENSRVDVLS